MHRTRTALLGAVAVVTLLAGCGGGDEPGDQAADSEPPQSTTAGEEPTASESPSESATEEPSGSPSAGESTGGEDSSLPPFPTNTKRQVKEPPRGGNLVLVDVRVGDHEGYDRLVLEFRGTGTPGWSVQYVKQVVQDGSGKKIALQGDAFLDVYASGTTYPMENEPSYDGPRQFEPENGGDIEDVYVGGTFEGSTQVAIGVDDRRVPFRVFPLSRPARLVVDIQSD